MQTGGPNREKLLHHAPWYFFILCSSDQTGMRDHMDSGDAWRCKLKILYENSCVPQFCTSCTSVLHHTPSLTPSLSFSVLSILTPHSTFLSPHSTFHTPHSSLLTPHSSVLVFYIFQTSQIALLLFGPVQL